MTFTDLANRDHAFTWNDTYGAYCYAPTSQQECDDIISTNWMWSKCLWKFSVVMDGVPSAPGQPQLAAPLGFKPPPYVRPEIYADYPLRDLLDLCTDSQFLPEGDATNPDHLRWQLHRYYEGRAWAADEIKRLKEKLDAKPAAAAQKPAALDVAEESFDVPAVPPAPAKGKRGRPPKNRELQTA